MWHLRKKSHQSQQIVEAEADKKQLTPQRTSLPFSGPLSPSRILSLQRLVGNNVVRRIIADHIALNSTSQQPHIAPDIQRSKFNRGYVIFKENGRNIFLSTQYDADQVLTQKYPSIVRIDVSDEKVLKDSPGIGLEAAENEKKLKAQAMNIPDSGNVLINCKNGRSRTPAVLIAFLILQRGIDWKSAKNTIQLFYDAHRGSDVEADREDRFTPHFKNFQKEGGETPAEEKDQTLINILESMRDKMKIWDSLPSTVNKKQEGIKEGIRYFWQAKNDFINKIPEQYSGILAHYDDVINWEPSFEIEEVEMGEVGEVEKEVPVTDHPNEEENMELVEITSSSWRGIPQKEVDEVVTQMDNWNKFPKGWLGHH